MLALFLWPISVPFFLLTGAAVALGLSGGTLGMDIPPWLAIPVIAACVFLGSVIYTLVAIRKGWCASCREDEDASKRIVFALRTNVRDFLQHLAYGVLLCSPGLFILTGTLWTWVIAGVVAFVISLRDFAAIA